MLFSKHICLTLQTDLKLKQEPPPALSHDTLFRTRLSPHTWACGRCGLRLPWPTRSSSELYVDVSFLPTSLPVALKLVVARRLSCLAVCLALVKRCALMYGTLPAFHDIMKPLRTLLTLHLADSSHPHELQVRLPAPRARGLARPFCDEGRHCFCESGPGVDLRAATWSRAPFRLPTVRRVWAPAPPGTWVS